MNCLRCGRETTDDHTFCDHCLQTMEKYPVRPGTAVMLPKHKDAPVPKKTKHHLPPPPAEQIRRLKKQRLILSVVITMLIALMAAAFFVGSRYMKAEHLRPGQNYSAVETTAPTA